MRAFVLAGGLGTRLRSIVPNQPKPMAPVENRPFLVYLVERLRDHGIREIVFCVGHLAEEVQSYFGDGSAWGVRLDYAVEAALLGTAGAVWNAREFIDGTFLLMNGDTYLELDFNKLLDAHLRARKQDSTAIATIAALRVEDARSYGGLELTDQLVVAGFCEKGVSGSGWINGGVYVLEQDIMQYIPQGRPVSLEKEVFPQLIQRGLRLYGYPVAGYFVDIGTPEGYARFTEYIQSSGK